MSTCDVFNNCLFSLDVQNTAATKSLLLTLFMAGFFIEFLLRNALLVKVGNPISDGIVFVFHLAGCVSDSGLT